MEIPVVLQIANGIKGESYLNNPRFAWFRKGYEYAGTQTAAIPALSAVTPEELFSAVWAVMRGAGLQSVMDELEKHEQPGGLWQCSPQFVPVEREAKD